MKATNSTDGINRVNLRVTHRLSLDELALHFTSLHQDKAYLKAYCGKARVLADVRTYLETDGEERSQYVVGDDKELSLIHEKVLLAFRGVFYEEFPEG